MSNSEQKQIIYKVQWIEGDKIFKINISELKLNMGDF